MSKMNVVRVTRTEFELVDGRVFPIDPPLKEDMTLDDFQDYYDLAASFVSSVQALGDNPENTQTMGCGRKDQDCEESR